MELIPIIIIISETLNSTLSGVIVALILEQHYLTSYGVLCYAYNLQSELPPRTSFEVLLNLSTFHSSFILNSSFILKFNSYVLQCYFIKVNKER